MASVESNKMLAVAVAACDDKKAEDIRILALDPAESGLSDYFLICTGTNDRQTVAITDEIEIRLKREFGTYPNAVEGRRQGEWILMDYVDFIVHVFLPEKRAYYGLERLRPSATTLSVADLNAEIKAAIRAERAPKKAKTAGDTASSGAEDENESSPKAAPRKRPMKAKSSPGKTMAKKATAGTITAKAAGKKSLGKKVGAKKAVSAKALDTRAAARAAINGVRKPATKKAVAKKAAAKKRARGE